jgi:hypothetical protein
MAKLLKGWLQPPQIFLKKLRAIWKVLDTIGQIAKIETLMFKLKNIVNFERVNYNFSILLL